MEDWWNDLAKAIGVDRLHKARVMCARRANREARAILREQERMEGYLYVSTLGLRQSGVQYLED
jgi:hypothetical protein